MLSVADLRPLERTMSLVAGPSRRRTGGPRDRCNAENSGDRGIVAAYRVLKGRPYKA